MSAKPKKKIKPGIYRAWREKPAPGWYYIYDIRLDGRRVRTPRGLYFPTIKECDDAVSSLRADLRRKAYRFPADDARVTIAQVRDLWLAAIRSRRRSAGYINATERSFKALSKVIPLGRPVKDLKTDDLAALERTRAGTVERVTVGHDLAHILYALKYAAEHLPDLADWKPPRLPEGTNATRGRARNRLISREEEMAILRALRSNPTNRTDGDQIRRLAADAFELALLTGMRAHEILGLRKRDIHLDRSPGYAHGWLIARSGKTGDERTIPLTERSAAILRARVTRAELPFALGAAKIKTRVSQLDRLLGLACEDAGIPYGAKTDNGLVFHDTRHTVITRLLQNGADLRTVMDLVGHKNPATTLAVYSHATAKSRATAIQSLSRVPSASDSDEAQPTPTDSKQKPGIPKS
jgi:integrase